MERTRIADMAQPPLRQALEGLPAARRPRAGAAPQPRRADPRRADGRPRPEADHRDAAADQGAGRRPHDHPQHAHPSRGQPDLPARRHHQQGQGRRGRHAGQPDRAAARIGDDVRAGGRAWAPTRRRRCTRLPASRASPSSDTRDGDRRLRSRQRAGPRRAARACASTVVGRGWGLLELRPMRMSLEEIFLQSDDRRSGGAPRTAAEAGHE